MTAFSIHHGPDVLVFAGLISGIVFVFLLACCKEGQ